MKLNTLEKFWLRVFRHQGMLGIYCPHPANAAQDFANDALAIFRLEKAGLIENKGVGHDQCGPRFGNHFVIKEAK